MTFTTNGLRYEIREVSNVLDEIRKMHGSKMGFRGELSGVTFHEDGLILIGRDQSRAQKAKTLLHEATHAVLPALSERNVLRLENDLYPVLRRCGFLYPDEI